MKIKKKDVQRAAQAARDRDTRYSNSITNLTMRIAEIENTLRHSDRVADGESWRAAHNGMCAQIDGFRQIIEQMRAAIIVLKAQVASLQADAPRAIPLPKRVKKA
jgi:hypothetical protein